MSKHTPTPYHVGTLALNLGVLEIGGGPNARRIATLEGRDYSGREGVMFCDAAFIVRACNAHDALIAAAKAAESLYAKTVARPETNPAHPIHALRAAIAAAEKP